MNQMLKAGVLRWDLKVGWSVLSSTLHYTTVQYSTTRVTLVTCCSLFLPPFTPGLDICCLVPDRQEAADQASAVTPHWNLHADSVGPGSPHGGLVRLRLRPFLKVTEG